MGRQTYGRRVGLSLSGMELRSLAAVAALMTATSFSGAFAAASPAASSKCIQAEEARVAEDEGAPPKLSARFYMRTFSLEVSVDGLDGPQLPVSIEEICDVPKPLRKQAAGLAGADGVALITARTTVWANGKRVQGADATAALDGADTATLRVRLVPLRRWGQDEDGDKVPTFTARRITITD